MTLDEQVNDFGRLNAQKKRLERKGNLMEHIGAISLGVAGLSVGMAVIRALSRGYSTYSQLPSLNQASIVDYIAIGVGVLAGACFVKAIGRSYELDDQIYELDDQISRDEKIAEIATSSGYQANKTNQHRQ